LSLLAGLDLQTGRVHACIEDKNIEGWGEAYALATRQASAEGYNPLTYEFRNTNSKLMARATLVWAR
jgi:hypothetical protein